MQNYGRRSPAVQPNMPRKPSLPKLTVTRPGPHHDPASIKISTGTIDMDALDLTSRMAAGSIIQVFLAAGLPVDFEDTGE